MSTIFQSNLGSVWISHTSSMIGWNFVWPIQILARHKITPQSTETVVIYYIIPDHCKLIWTFENCMIQINNLPEAQYNTNHWPKFKLFILNKKGIAKFYCVGNIDESIQSRRQRWGKLGDNSWVCSYVHERRLDVKRGFIRIQCRRNMMMRFLYHSGNGYAALQPSLE